MTLFRQIALHLNLSLKAPSLQVKTAAGTARHILFTNLHCEINEGMSMITIFQKTAFWRVRLKTLFLISVNRKVGIEKHVFCLLLP